MKLDIEVYTEEIKKLYRMLAEIPAVSGKEECYAEKMRQTVLMYTDFFDKSEILAGGGLLFTHSCGVPNARKLLIDAHFDTVGFIVSEILDGGFVRVEAVGGIDRRLLFASEAEIYGRKTIKGVFVSTPPHLSKKDKDAEKKLPPLSEMFIDTGYTKEELCDIVSVGDACGFTFSYKELRNGIICGRSMDDRICAVAVLLAAKITSEDKNYVDKCDIIFSFSSAEEVNGSGGAVLGRLLADGAVVMDVNFGRDYEIAPQESYILGEGCGVSYSCTTSRALTDALVSCAEKSEIPLQKMVEPKSTGTNANYISNAYLGTPCAVLSIPEKYMHTAVEAVDIKDVYSCAKLLCEFFKVFPEFADNFEKSRKIIPMEGVLGNEL